MACLSLWGLGFPGHANCGDYGQRPARAVVGSYRVGPMQGGVVRGQGLWGWCGIKVPQL